jgi:glycosyltransferase 2 family protein
VTVAQLGDAYRAYLLKKQARVSLAGSVGTILAERLTDLVGLVAMLGLAALVAFAGHLLHQAADVLVVGLALAAVGLAGIGGLRRMRPVASRIIPERWQDAYERFEIGTIASFRRIPLLLLTSALGWLIEGATIYLLAAAVAAPVSPAGALVAGLVASLLSIEPLTPGGLGATEAGIVLVMRSLGVDPDTAAAVAVLNRVVNYLSLAVVGPLLYVAPGLSGLGTLLPWPRVSRPPTRRGRASAVDGETPSADLRPPEIVPAGRPGTSVSRHIRD